MNYIGPSTWQVCNDITETIKTTAKEITNDSLTISEKANKIIAWVKKNIIYSLAWRIKHFNRKKVYYVNPDDIIKEGFGACLEQAAVCAVLMKAIGITSSIGVIKKGWHAVTVFTIGKNKYMTDFSTHKTELVKSTITEYQI